MAFHVIDDQILFLELDRPEPHRQEGVEGGGGGGGGGRNDIVRLYRIVQDDCSSPSDSLLLLQSIPSMERVQHLVWSRKSSQFLIYTSESIKVFEQESFDKLRWREISSLQMIREIAVATLSFCYPLLFITSLDQEALLLNLKQAISHSFEMNDMVRRNAKNCAISWSSRYLSWFDQSFSQQEFKVFDLSPILHPSLSLLEKSSHAFDFKSDFLHMEGEETVREVVWRHSYNSTNSELVALLLNSGKILLCEVLQQAELEDDTIVAIALNAAIVAGVVSETEQPTVDATSHAVTYKPYLRLLKEIDRVSLFGGVGIAEDKAALFELKSIAWIHGHTDPILHKRSSVSGLMDKAIEKPTTPLLKRTNSSLQGGQRTSFLTSQTPKKAGGNGNVSDDCSPSSGSWMAIAITNNEAASESKLMLVRFAYDATTSSYALNVQLSVAVKFPQSNAESSFSSLRINHITGIFETGSSFPRRVVVGLEIGCAELQAKDSVILAWASLCSTTDNMNKTAFSLLPNKTHNYLVCGNSKAFASFCQRNNNNNNSNYNNDPIADVNERWKLAVNTNLSDCTVRKIMASFLLPNDFRNAQVLKSLCLSLPFDLFHNVWLLLVQIDHQGKREYKAAFFRAPIASLPSRTPNASSLKAPSMDSSLSMSRFDDGNGGGGLDEAENDQQLHYTVEIIPDPQLGLGLRLDEVRAARDSKSIRIIATNFKRHPKTNECLAAELSGSIRLGDELVGINEFYFAGEPLSAVIPSIRNILTTTPADETVQLVFKKVKTTTTTDSTTNNNNNNNNNNKLNSEGLSLKVPSRLDDELCVSREPIDLFLSDSAEFYEELTLPVIGQQDLQILSTNAVLVEEVCFQRPGYILTAQVSQTGSVLSLFCNWFRLDCGLGHLKESKGENNDIRSSLCCSSTITLPPFAQDLSEQAINTRIDFSSIRSLDNRSVFYVVVEVVHSSLSTFTSLVVFVRDPKSGKTSLQIEEMKKEDAMLLDEVNAIMQHGPSVRTHPIARDLQLYARLRSAPSVCNSENRPSLTDRNRGSTRGSISSKAVEDETKRGGLKPILLFANLSSTFVSSAISSDSRTKTDNAKAFYMALHSLLGLNPSYTLSASMLGALDASAVNAYFVDDPFLHRTLLYLQDKLRNFVQQLGMPYSRHLAHPAVDKGGNTKSISMEATTPENIMLGDCIASPTAFVASFILLSALEMMIYPFFRGDLTDPSIVHCIENAVQMEDTSEAHIISTFLGHLSQVLQIDKYAELMLCEMAVQHGWMTTLMMAKAALYETDPKLFSRKEMLLHPDNGGDEEDGRAADVLSSAKQVDQADQSSASGHRHCVLSGAQVANLLFSSSQLNTLEMFFQSSLGLLPRKDSDELPSTTPSLKTTWFRVFMGDWMADRNPSCGDASKKEKELKPSLEQSSTTTATAALDVLSLAVDLKVSLWLRDVEPLFDIIYQHCMMSFKKKKSAMDIFLEMVVIGKVDRLLQLAKADSSPSGKQLLALLYMTDETFNAFNNKPDKFRVLQTKLRKNAFALIRKHRYREAAAVFLLFPSSSMIKSAQSVLVKQYDQPLLAHLILRLIECRLLNASSIEEELLGNTVNRSSATYDVLNYANDSKELVLMHKSGGPSGPFSENLLKNDILPALLSASKENNPANSVKDLKSYHSIGIHGITGLEASVLALVCALWVQEEDLLCSVYADIYKFLDDAISDNHLRSYELMNESELPLELISLMSRVYRDDLPMCDILQLFKYLHFSKANTLYLSFHFTLQTILPFLVECGAFIDKESILKMLGLLDRYYTSNGMFEEKLHLLTLADHWTQQESNALLNGNAFHESVLEKAARLSKRISMDRLSFSQRQRVDEDELMEQSEASIKNEEERGSNKLSFNFAKVFKPAAATVHSTTSQSPKPGLDFYDSMTPVSISRDASLSSMASSVPFGLDELDHTSNPPHIWKPSFASDSSLVSKGDVGIAIDDFDDSVKLTRIAKPSTPAAVDPYANVSGSALDMFDTVSRPSRVSARTTPSSASASVSASSSSSSTNVNVTATSSGAGSQQQAPRVTSTPAAAAVDPYANVSGSALDMFDNASRPSRVSARTAPSSASASVSVSASSSSSSSSTNVNGGSLSAADAPNVTTTSSGASSQQQAPRVASTPAAAVVDPYANVSGSALDMFDTVSRPSRVSARTTPSSASVSASASSSSSSANVNGGSLSAADAPNVTATSSGASSQQQAPRVASTPAAAVVDPYANVSGSALDMFDTVSRPSRVSARTTPSSASVSASASSSSSSANVNGGSLSAADAPNVTTTSSGASSQQQAPRVASTPAAAVVDPYANVSGSALDMFDTVSRPSRVSARTAPSSASASVSSSSSSTNANVTTTSSGASSQQQAPRVVASTPAAAAAAVDPYANVSGSALDMFDTVSRPSRVSARTTPSSASASVSVSASSSSSSTNVNGGSLSVSDATNVTATSSGASSQQQAPRVASTPAAAAVDPYANAKNVITDGVVSNIPTLPEVSEGTNARSEIHNLLTELQELDESSKCANDSFPAGSGKSLLDEIITFEASRRTAAEPTEPVQDAASVSNQEQSLPPAKPAGVLLVPFKRREDTDIEINTKKKEEPRVNSHGKWFSRPFSSESSHHAPPSPKRSKRHMDDSSSHSKASSGGTHSKQSTPNSSTHGYGALHGGRTLEQKLLDFYTIHNPAKLPEVPTILSKYHGREQELIMKLQKQYNAKVL
eukprot:gene3293-3612_t